MHLMIINCTPRKKSESNTTEIYHLSERKSWDDIRLAFAQNDNILMAVPLFVECIPGIMAEFLESLPPKTDTGQKTKLAFILQGGFSEASQLRCGEQYLSMLPGYLNCRHNGTLIKGNMFITHMLPVQAQEKTVQPFAEMGRRFAQDGCFTKALSDAFAGEEYFSKAMIAAFTIMGPIQKLFFSYFFKKKGLQYSLKAKPYQSYLEHKK